MTAAAKKAVVLFSGGLDSSTCLYWAKRQGYKPIALTVDYGQRHAREVRSARRIAKFAGAVHYDIKLDLKWLRSSSLVDKNKKLPNLPLKKIGAGVIPSTYVPGRNTVLLSLALSLAEAEKARAIIIGANHVDYSGYPDCRPGFIKAFEQMAAVGTKAGVELRSVSIIAPLLKLDKEAIVYMAKKLRVPLKHTWSCYRGGVEPCGLCDSCKLRAKGFERAGVRDPIYD